MSGYVSIEDFKREQKRREFWNKVKSKGLDAVCFFENHRELCLIAVPAVAAAITGVVKFTGKRINLNKEQRLKERFIYDRREGHYWELRRTPKASEWSMISMRKDNGETYQSILTDMGLLKQ